MADAVELRRALANFLGAAQYRKFVEQGFAHRRLRHWQEAAWARFTAEHPEFGVGLDELAAALRVCHLHGDVLLADSAKVLSGCVDHASSYVEARTRLFPHAALDVVFTEGQPLASDTIMVWFCPTCRAAHAEWRAKHG